MILRRRRWIFYIGAALLAATTPIYSQAVFAENESPQSTNYRFDETAIGVGGLMESSSANYTATDSVGSLSIGRAASANYQVIAGSKTTNDPVLKVAVTSGNANFGVFSAGGTATATATFSISNYTTFGYAVYMTGGDLANGTHTIPSMATTSPAQVGIEQFGFNLVANTVPASFGANLDNGGFGFGEIAPDYAVPNEFRYVHGELIAGAPKDSGMTNYTLSYIANVASLTPGGQYTSSQTLIVVGTY